jgi:type VI secretion system protein ImpA
MRHENLLKPVSEAEPCGPDLDEIGDDKFLNYMMQAENKLPARYLDLRQSVEGVLFDPTTIDLKAELKAIAELLEETRDLRLLTLEARFQALSGQIEGFSDSVQSIAALLATFWDDVHPKGFDGDFTLRVNTVAALDERATVVAALDYAPLLRDQRVGSITLRTHALATGTVEPRENERAIDINLLMETMRSETHRPALDRMHASIAACQAAVTSIQSSFDQATNFQFSPDFDVLRGALARLRSLIELGRPDLASGSPPLDDTAGEQSESTPAGASTPQPGVGRAQATGMAVPAPARLDAVAIADRQAAAAALLAAERYFGQREPSSPALILVHQSRMLVGQPLVIALDALLPDKSDQAAMVVDSNFGFEFSMAKMRAITEDYTSNADETDNDLEAVPAFDAQTRQQATALIGGVAAFFRTSEPSSPIPMLLGRAERFLNQSFQAILADIMPKKTSD